MAYQDLLNTLLGAVLCALGWFAHQIWNDLKRVKSDLDIYKLHVSENYTKKSEVDTLRAEMGKRFDKLENMINRLFEKIDMKVDK